ncbi:MAG: hypothetical protein JWN52_4075 [Actinomycetia bacterium]|nr:hypothetical protein [Actinomycetes bacterium]
MKIIAPGRRCIAAALRTTPGGHRNVPADMEGFYDTAKQAGSLLFRHPAVPLGSGCRRAGDEHPARRPAAARVPGRLHITTLPQLRALFDRPTHDHHGERDSRVHRGGVCGPGSHPPSTRRPSPRGTTPVPTGGGWPDRSHRGPRCVRVGRHCDAMVAAHARRGRRRGLHCGRNMESALGAEQKIALFTQSLLRPPKKPGGWPSQVVRPPPPQAPPITSPTCSGPCGPIWKNTRSPAVLRPPECAMLSTCKQGNPTQLRVITSRSTSSRLPVWAARASAPRRLRSGLRRRT